MPAQYKLRDLKKLRYLKIMQKVASLWKPSKQSILGSSLRTFLDFIRLSIQGVREHAIGSQAAALSYYSLMSLGPLVALSVLVSSFVFRDKSEALASHILSKVIVFVAPSVSHLEGGSLGSAPDIFQSLQSDNLVVIDWIQNLVRHAQSGEAGFWGTLLLIAICIQLIITIEKALNTIWSTPVGRPWFQRLTAYWAFLTLGTFISLVGFGLVSGSVAAAIFSSEASAGMGALQAALDYAPKLSYMLMVVGALALFYRYLPYTEVRWKSAFFGSGVAAGFLALNHYLSFLYIQKAIQDQSLYGSIGIIFVLMFGLFVFWWILLLGGLLSYVFQNLKRLRGAELSATLSLYSKELMGIALFLYIARCFYKRLAPPSLDSLHKALNFPLKSLEEALQVLCNLQLVHGIHPEDPASAHRAYQPSLPLEHVTLFSLKEALSQYGALPKALALTEDPILKLYQEALKAPHLPKVMTEPLSDILSQES